MDNNRIVRWTTLNFVDFLDRLRVECISREAVNGFSRYSNNLSGTEQFRRALRRSMKHRGGVSRKNFGGPIHFPKFLAGARHGREKVI
jgi:hypothetical protein